MNLAIGQIARAHEALEVLQDELAVQATHDPLTGLANRTQSMRLLAGALGRKAPAEIVLLPVPHAALWRDAGAREEDAGRAGILGRLLRGEPLWVIAPARGLEAPLPVPADFRRQVLTLGAGDSVDREALVEHLESAGYERVESVTGVGQWALRGGIVDVFSPAGSLPVRIELTGDDIDSLRTFDPTSQRSTGDVAALLPVGGSIPPYLQKNFLDHILGFLPLVQHSGSKIQR